MQRLSRLPPRCVFFFFCFLPSAQVLCLTHEAATAEERMPYLEYIMHPVPVVSLFGRSAALGTTCKKQNCVWYGWKESLQVSPKLPSGPQGLKAAAALFQIWITGFVVVLVQSLW